jgi:hypothetical protein
MIASAKAADLPKIIGVKWINASFSGRYRAIFVFALPSTACE